MQLKLTKPLAFFDLETTGINVGSDRIVEISIVRVNIDNTTDILTKKVNPTIPIPEFTSKIHGIYDKDIIDCPTFKELAPQLSQFLTNCDLAGFNSNKFDVPVLVEEFLRADIDFDLKNRKLIDVQNIYHTMEPRNLTAAYKFYCDRNLEDAHTAEADAMATFEVLEAQVVKYPQIGNTVESIVKFTGEDQIIDFARRFVYENGVAVFNFGKHKGKPVTQVLKEEPQYYDWMMKGDFALHTKQKLTEILNKSILNK